jgi:alpha-beta hydrolase superfamily lysophospholipase
MDFSIVLKNKQVLRGILNVPSDNPRAFIILVHGIGEHIKRYSHWVEWFSAEGIGFIGVDLPGHGRSDGKRGHINNYSVLSEMIDTLINITTKTYPEVPIFVYGHSLGGGIVLDYLLHNKKVIKGAIVTSPWLRLAFEPARIKRLIAGLLKNIVPALSQSTGLIVSYISHDKEIINKYLTDPLVHGKISVSFFYGAVTSARYSLSHASSLNVPLLILHGSDDQITSPEASLEFASQSSLAEIKIWDGGYHELHNEPFKKDVFDYIINWINNHL